MDKENLVDIYYEKLGSQGSPNVTLARFYEELFYLPFSRANLVMFGRLVKVYGRYIPFFAILDLYSYEGADLSKEMFGLLSYYCKRRVENRSANIVLNDAYKDLEKRTKTLLDEIEKRKQSPLRIRREEE